MDTSGNWPSLSEDDPLFEVADYTQVLKPLLDRVPRGFVARLVDNTESTGLSSTAIMCNKVTLNAVANRWYRATYQVTTVGGAGDAISWDFVKSVTTDNTTAGTSMKDGTSRFFYTAAVAGNSKTDLVTTTWKATTTETVNIKAVLARATGSAGYNINSRVLTVEDLGVWF